VGVATEKLSRELKEKHKLGEEEKECINSSRKCLFEATEVGGGGGGYFEVETMITKGKRREEIFYQEVKAL